MGEGEIPKLLAIFDEATGSRNWHRLAQVVAADCAIVDHRPLGLGTVDRARWIESLALRAELSDNARPVVVRTLASHPRCTARSMSLEGTYLTGGPIDYRFITVIACNEVALTRIEFFDVTDEAAALARYEELCALLPC